MRQSQRWIAGPLVGFVLLLSACATAPEEETAESGGATYDGEVVVMDPQAVERLDMQVAPVRNAGKAAGGSQKTIPYAAVFYGTAGETWAYANPEPETFERATIVIDRIVGDTAFLSDGPPEGTQVVTQGAAELFGVETGIDQ
jgi:hypothetical protein